MQGHWEDEKKTISSAPHSLIAPKLCWDLPSRPGSVSNSFLYSQGLSKELTLNACLMSLEEKNGERDVILDSKISQCKGRDRCVHKEREPNMKNVTKETLNRVSWNQRRKSHWWLMVILENTSRKAWWLVEEQDLAKHSRVGHSRQGEQHRWCAYLIPKLKDSDPTEGDGLRKNNT